MIKASSHSVDEATALQVRYPFPTRERYECNAADIAGLDPSPAPIPSPPVSPGAGEALFTDGQKVALLVMRGSDWSKAILAHLRAFGRDQCGGDDYRALAARGLAVSRGAFHTLTATGRHKADQVAIEIARAEGLHVMTYHAGRRGPSSKAASARCTCGWSSYVTTYARDYLFTLRRHGVEHLKHVGQYVASEAV